MMTMMHMHMPQRCCFDEGIVDEMNFELLFTRVVMRIMALPFFFCVSRSLEVFHFSFCLASARLLPLIYFQLLVFVIGNGQAWALALALRA
jgi:hypothetical protein